MGSTPPSSSQIPPVPIETNTSTVQKESTLKGDQICSGDTKTPPAELRRLLEEKDQEINVLKFELEKYKLAYHQSQLERRNQPQVTTPRFDSPTKNPTEIRTIDLNVKLDPLAISPINVPSSLADDSANNRRVSISDRHRTSTRALSEDTSDIMPDDSSLSKESSSRLNVKRQSTASASSNVSQSSSRVLFRAGHFDDDDDDDNEDGDNNVHGIDDREKDDTDHDNDEVGDEKERDDITSGDMQDILHDVGEIDLELELTTTSEHNRQKSKKSGVDSRLRSGSESSDDKNCPGCDVNEGNGGGQKDTEKNNNQGEKINEDEEDIITDGLLTSLTDAAISNLSQLAALQEQCESQHQYRRQRADKPPLHHQLRPHQQAQRHEMNSNRLVSAAQTSVATTPIVTSISASPSSGLGPIGRSQSASLGSAVAPITSSTRRVREDDAFRMPDPFSASTIANQAALAISAAAAAAAAASNNQAPNSSSGLLTQSSAIQAQDLSGSHSLASVVAAAAAAAAAANDQQQQQQQHLQHRLSQQLQPAPQTRLISSALSSSEFYHSLNQQQQSHAQQPSMQQSPVSSLHFSPSTSITPSPSSLVAPSTRRSISNASSVISPIASPNYLRRPFMNERLPLLSPSPTSLTTGSSSAASTSLAHILQHHHHHHQHHQQRSSSALAGPITSTTSTPISGTGSSAVSPIIGSKNSSQARLNNMQIRHKFGYLGSSRAQFNSPHGFCLGLNQEIVVADTNNHRVCIFDKSGTYITQFGSPGKEEGQLWNPRKVAILYRQNNSSSLGGNNSSVHQTTLRQHGQITSSSYHGHHGTSGTGATSSGLQSGSNIGNGSFGSEPLYVVCDRGAERSRMQLFTKDGAFIKKIGIHYIDIVAGLAITQNGLIIVVDSVSPTVYIINGETGSLNGWFDCSGHMKEPSDIAVKSDVPGNEYFICDFKGHCVVVFSEQGEYLRKIGHDGLTSYPNGIDISDDGDILVGDSHGNRFHVVVFDRNGNFVSQFECPHVKVSRCCGLKITREGYIVTLAKNNHHVLVLDTIHI